MQQAAARKASKEAAQHARDREIAALLAGSAPDTCTCARQCMCANCACACSCKGIQLFQCSFALLPSVLLAQIMPTA